MLSVLVAVVGEVIFHRSVQVFLLAVENIYCVGLEILPHVCVVLLQIAAYQVNFFYQSLHAPVDIALAGVRSWPHHVLDLFLILIDFKVPNLLMGSQGLHEVSLLVLDLAVLHWVANRAFFVLLCVAFLRGLKQHHMLALSALEHISVDTFLSIRVAHVFEPHKKDKVLKVLQHVLVD
jgi:hypothetical protein